MKSIPKVLFLSKGSASRSEMAEGFLRTFAGDRVIAVGAGTESGPMSPILIEVMREIGIDIIQQQPRELASLFHETFRYVVAMCDGSKERFPVFPFTPNLLRWSVPEPIAFGGRRNRKTGVSPDAG
jgi:protein-tyrosine-phosphatase